MKDFKCEGSHIRIGLIDNETKIIRINDVLNKCEGKTPLDVIRICRDYEVRKMNQGGEFNEWTPLDYNTLYCHKQLFDKGLYKLRAKQ